MDPYWIAAVVPLVVQFFLFMRWLHRRLRDDEIHRAFVRDMAINHLPHIYAVLRLIADHLGISFSEPPPIRFVDINGGERNPRRR
jgi:hypothetical protein